MTIPLKPSALLATMLALGLMGCQQLQPVNFIERRIITPSDESANPPTVAAATTMPFTEINYRCLGNRVMVLMYHDVVPTRTKDTLFYDITVSEFREQITFLRENGANILTMDQLYQHMVEGTDVPPKSVVITFDDNYQGVIDYAAPILKEADYPFAVFVHTDYVGNRTVGRPKMTWDELALLMKDYKATIGSHTSSHPQDMRIQRTDEIWRELSGSRDAIEKNLGIQTPYLSWPGGNFDPFTLDVAETVGYRMAFAMDSGLAENSAGIMEIRRYPFNKFDQGWKRLIEESQPEYAYSETPLDIHSDISLKTIELPNKRFISAVIGGAPVSVMSNGRKQVGDYVKEQAAVGGVNGGFFAMSAIQSDDNRMLGPCLPGVPGIFVQSAENIDMEKLRNRPLVAWDGDKIAFIPFVPQTMNEEYRLRQFMPNLTDAFLAGAWLVRDGKPLTKEQIKLFGASDALEIRPRSFLGVTTDGAIVLGSSQNSVSSDTLAIGAAELGCLDAVLLDSGYSTSLYFQGQVIASGHKTKAVKSRPVPHVIVVRGNLAPGAEKPVSVTQTAPISSTPKRS